MTENSQIFPIVVALKFLRRTYWLIIGCLVIGGIFGWYKAHTTEKKYASEMVIESETIDKNVMLQLVDDLSSKTLTPYFDSPKLLEGIAIKAYVVDIKDRVITENTQPSKMTEIRVSGSDPKVFIGLGEAIVDALGDSDYAKEIQVDPQIKIVSDFGEPRTVDNSLKNFVTYLAISLIGGILIAIVYDVIRTANQIIREDQ